MNLDRRLCRLEARSSEASGCPECGLPSDGPVGDYEVLWDDAGDADPVEPESCETCGRQTVFVVGWADIEPSEATPGEGGR